MARKTFQIREILTYETSCGIKQRSAAGAYPSESPASRSMAPFSAHIYIICAQSYAIISRSLSGTGNGSMHRENCRGAALRRSIAKIISLPFPEAFPGQFPSNQLTINIINIQFPGPATKKPSRYRKILIILGNRPSVLYGQLV